MRPHRGTTILVLGVLSLVVCAPLGIPAWVMANADLKAMDAGEMDPEGRSSTQAGKICGMITSIILIIAVGLWLLMALGLGVAAVFDLT